MKVIHNLKNPIISASKIIENSTIDKEMKSDLNFEFDSIKEMLDALRIEFKSRNGMEVNEESKNIITLQMANSIFNTHKKLADNGGNNILIEIEQNFPQEINIKPTLLKRI